MEKIVFNCLRCGHCCQNLIVDVKGELKGLGLSLEETKLFPEKFVSPSYGIGYGGKDRPKHIIIYQLNVSECPHLSEGNLCKIHEKRPLSCRAFPLESVGPLGTIVEPTYCHFMEDYIRKHGSLNTQFMTPEEFIAPEEWDTIPKIVEQVQEKLREHNRRDADLFWSFSLKTKKWEISSTIDTAPFVFQDF